MWIGAAKITLDFYGNDLAKVKHRELEELCKDLKKKFNISILEIEEFEDPEKCILGFSLVMPSDWKKSSAESLVQKICQTIDQTAFTRVTSEDWEVFSI